MTAPIHARADRRRSGFTLLEVMAAMVIFLVGIVGVLALFASGLAIHRTATQRAVVAAASEDVRARIEALLADLPANVDLPKVERVPVEGHVGYYYSAVLTPDPDRGIEGGVLAQVRVFTLEAGAERGEAFTVFTRPKADAAAEIRRALGAK